MRVRFVLEFSNDSAHVNTYNIRMMCIRVMYSYPNWCCANVYVYVGECVCAVCNASRYVVPVSCGAATTCASTCIGGARRTTLNVPGAASKFSGASKPPW